MGFRHAATLLLTNRLRGIARNATPVEIGDALRRLADDLSALATDMRMPPDAGAWLSREYSATLARLRQVFDADAAKDYATRAFANVGNDHREDGPRNLFIVYVPEDRLPVAAPLAIALAKRRLSVAFSGFEVETPQELVAAIADGLTRHTAGLVLGTAAFDRAGLLAHVVESHRLRVLTVDQATDVEALVRWSKTCK